MPSLDTVRSFVRDEKGEDLIEYGLLASFVAVSAAAVLISDPLAIRSSLVTAFQKAVEALILAVQTDVRVR